MTDLIDEILVAEQSARDVIAKAKDLASKMIENNDKECEKILNQAVENSKKDRKDSLEMAKGKADEDAKKLLQAKTKELEYFKEQLQSREYNFAEEIVGRIKKWQ